MSKPMKALFFLFTFFLMLSSFANNPGISYQGRIFKPDGAPLEGSSVQFRLQVRSPGSENCLLYEEVQTLNMAGSSGVFALTLNDGTGTRLDAATYQVDRIFANRETMTLDTTRCATGTTYTPNSSDGRKLVVYFKDETMASYEAMPLMNLNYVPQAMYALEAQKVDKFEVSNILRAVDGSGNPAAAPALNPTQLTNLNTLLATPAANYVQTTTNGSVALPVVAGNPSSGLAAGQIWYDSGSNVMKYYDGAVKTFGTSGGGVTSLTAGTGLTGGTITTSGTIAVDVGVTTGKIIQVAASNKLPVIDGSNLTNIAATDASKLPLAGGTMTGPLVNNSNSASTALAVSQAGAGYAASFMGGNVGVGTASPTAPLHVRAQTPPNVAKLEAGCSGCGVWLSLINSDSNVGTNNASGIRFHTVGEGVLSAHIMGVQTGGSSSYGSLVFATNHGGSLNEYMRIDHNGNIGIGTGSPSQKLDVAGAVRIVDAPAAGSSSAPNVLAIQGGQGGPTGGDGGGISMATGSGSPGTTGLGGNFDFTAGGGSAGGHIYLKAGSAYSGGAERPDGGIINIAGGFNGVNSGLVSVDGGHGGNGGPGGDVRLSGGTSASSSSSNGGNVYIDGGAKDGTGADGNVVLVNSRGKVGIGTETPSVPLTVHSSTGWSLPGTSTVVSVAEFDAPTNDRGIELGFDSTDNIGIIAADNGGASSQLAFYTADSAGIFAEKLRIAGNGYVGIGTTSPSTKFHVLGSSGATIATFADGGATTCTVTPASTGFACSSDERLKKNIETFSDSSALQNILQLRTVTYDWRSVDNGRHTGYIAQELEKIAPEIVRTGEDGFKQVNYTGLVPWITGAIKAFYTEFNAFRSEVKTSDENKTREITSVNSRADNLEAENADLKARLEHQEKELNAQKQELAAIKNKLGI